MDGSASTPDVWSVEGLPGNRVGGWSPDPAWGSGFTARETTPPGEDTAEPLDDSQALPLVIPPPSLSGKKWQTWNERPAVTSEYDWTASASAKQFGVPYPHSPEPGADPGWEGVPEYQEWAQTLEQYRLSQEINDSSGRAAHESASPPLEGPAPSIPADHPWTPPEDTGSSQN